MTDKPLADRIALVTGASRGIGAATARALGARARMSC
jgi:NAD(P)-dependent dehydrogenase (short-subunit alcohol dehydrogenase family)